MYHKQQTTNFVFPSPSADGAQPELFIFNELCALKDEKGPCKAIKDRFFFDIDTGRCEQFEYGGCAGNANNFMTLEACEEMCVVSADKSPCHLEEAPGPCRGMMTRYFFDKRSRECKHFFYGGCFGNANNFRSMAECQAKCQDPDFKPPEFCLTPMDRGTCDEAHRRFGYNPSTKKCHTFRYSGCGGNKNNFSHRRHCMKMCMNIRSKAHGTGLIRIRKKNINNIVFRSV
ncbi:tissue factor pathway inhibitor-like [Diretmus argenteus]